MAYSYITYISRQIRDTNLSSDRIRKEYTGAVNQWLSKKRSESWLPPAVFDSFRVGNVSSAFMYAVISKSLMYTSLKREEIDD